MPLKLPRFDSNVSLVDKNGKPTQAFHQWWQKFADAIEASVTDLEETIDRVRRISSHTEPTTILQAVDDGPTCTITVLDHVRVYADGTQVAVTGGTQTGLDSGVWYSVYYDDTSLAITNPTFVFTTNANEAQAAKAAGRHFCGMILTPDAASGETINSGGAYPVGGNAVGGELLA